MDTTEQLALAKVQQMIAVEAALEVLYLETTRIGRLFRKVDRLTGAR